MRSNDFLLHPHDHTWGEWSVMSPPPPPPPHRTPPTTPHHPLYLSILRGLIKNDTLPTLIYRDYLSHFNGITARGKVDLGIHNPTHKKKKNIPQFCCHFQWSHILMFLWMESALSFHVDLLYFAKEIEMTKGIFIPPQQRAVLDSIASCAAVFNRADTILSCLQLSDLFPPLLPSHRVPAATQMPPRWQSEECASAHLDDSKALICAETLSCSAEEEEEKKNPNTCTSQVLNLGWWQCCWNVPLVLLMKEQNFIP